MNDDDVGRFVREVWVQWAREQPNPKPSWLVPYDDLSAADREVDRRIGRAVWERSTAGWRASYDNCASDRIEMRKRIAALEAAALAALGSVDALHEQAIFCHRDGCAITRTTPCTCDIEERTAAWHRDRGALAALLEDA